MVLESWESDEANLDAPVLREVLFRVLANSMHKNVYRGARGCLLVMGLQQKERVAVFWSLPGVLEVKYDLDRTGMKT